MLERIALACALLLVGVAGCLGGGDAPGASHPRGPAGPTDPGTPAPPDAWIPHVLVGIPDTGINPYHELFHRPELTVHPCTYVPGISCDVEALPLSIGVHSTWEEAVEADRALLEAIEPGKPYWIPKTSFVWVQTSGCAPEEDETLCPGLPLLDPPFGSTTGAGHGTGTTSAVIGAAPDALLAFSQFRDVDLMDASDPPHLFAQAPVDVMSVSLSHFQSPVPAPSQQACERAHFFAAGRAPLFVKASGNSAVSGVLDCWNGHPGTIMVGGAYPADRSTDVHSQGEADVMGYFCPPWAVSGTIDEVREGGYCGTSFAAPGVAGALASVLLELRRAVNHTGGVDEAGRVAPPLPITTHDVRGAMNLTATYEPEDQYNDGDFIPGGPTREPRNEQAPWLDWGWGFYDATVAEVTLAFLLDGLEPDPRPAGAVQHMETLHTARKAAYGR